ncbi:MAG: hypothetical protein GF334_13315 [Candidatus Altiarchaeales archaeon]|nr:hypothetical protein [Candidatus Altiarchaeales archaeon]
MDSKIKTAAEKLLKIADAIEKEAFDCTYFVCQDCNHTANLTSIDTRRKEAAHARGIKHVASLTVDDVIACPACSGDMNYVSNEESDRFWVEAGADKIADVAAEMMSVNDYGPPMSDTEEGEAEEGAGPFDPVDEQAKNQKKDEIEEEMKSKGVDQDQVDLSFADDGPGEYDPPKKQETPTGDDVEPMPEPEPSADEKADAEAEMPSKPQPSKVDETSVSEEEQTDEEPEDFQEPEVPSEGEESDALVEETDVEEKPKKKKKDKPDDGDVAFPKEPKPKFEMPPKMKEKEASGDAYWKSVARYSVG